MQLVFIHALAHAQWSFYNWGFSKKLYYPNQLASSSSSSSSSSFLKAVITSRSIFSLLWSFSFPGCLWAQLQVVALPGTLKSNRPPELEEHCRAGPAGGAPPQTPCCESHPAQSSAEAVAFASFFRFCDCIWVQTGGFPGVCAQRPLPSRSCSLLASEKHASSDLSASQLCILIDQCCIRRKRGIGDAPPSLCSPLTWALCEISLWPPAEWSQLLLDNVRTCLYLPTKTCLKHSYKQKFKFENLL